MPTLGALARKAQSVPLPRALFAALGFVPIAALCIALFGLLPLHQGARWLVAPAGVFTIVLALVRPEWGRRAAAGYLAGIVATAAYDATRLGLVWAGLWPDFIPPIGRLAWLDAHASPVWGYVWRFFGNGGGMGMSFAMLPWAGARVGMVYGVLICGCLFLTLIFAPGAQDAMFHLGPATAAASIVGHLDYGAVLGWLVARWLPRLASAPAGAPAEAPVPWEGEAA